MSEKKEKIQYMGMKQATFVHQDVRISQKLAADSMSIILHSKETRNPT
jgi:hypothetical protein